MRHASLVSLEKMGSEERQKLLILLSIYEVRNIANNREEEKKQLPKQSGILNIMLLKIKFLHFIKKSNIN